MDFEADQLVYGSFPFRAGGYDLLARSPGCSAALTAEVITVCRRFGQPPASDASRPGLCAVRLPSGPWAVVGVIPQGDDDRGRPGALAFHALIIPARTYRRAGWNPFAFAPVLRANWSSQTPATLDRARGQIEPSLPPGKPTDPKPRSIVAALTRKRRVALEATAPIDDLARVVWAGLPGWARRRTSVATWAFSNENRFDLAAFPRLAGVALDNSYLLPAELDASPFAAAALVGPPHRLAARGSRDPSSLLVVWIGLVMVGLIALAWSVSQGWFGAALPESTALRTATASSNVAPALLDPTAAARVQAGLMALADRFAAFDVGPATDPTRLLTQTYEQLHYRGRMLTAADLDAIRRDPDPDKDRALAWHEQISRFVPAEATSWPHDFGSLSLVEQLASLGRSFHLDPTTPPVAVPAILITRLSRPGLIRPTPLAARFPALSDYARFLSKLPRADDPAAP